MKSLEDWPLAWPIKLEAKVVSDSPIQREDVLELLAQAHRIHETALQLNARINQLEGDNIRLTHENEFMLRQLNLREDA